MKEIKAK